MVENSNDTASGMGVGSGAQGLGSISNAVPDELRDDYANDFYKPITDTKKAGMGLAMSGGGYRAMLFHVGSLRRLNEAGLLRKLTRISSVSGGSITAGVLALAWPHLDWDDNGVARNFDECVAGPLFAFAKVTVDITSVLSGFLTRGRVASKLAKAYAKHLFGKAGLQDLPAEGEGPFFIFCATNLGNGALFRFNRAYMSDWMTGKFDDPEVHLAVAVAASSAFPPVLSPLMFDLPDGRTVALTDGGVYDNLGLEPVKKNCQTVFVSDGGGTFEIKEKAGRNWFSGTKRLLNVLDAQVRRLRRREVVGALASGHRQGAFWAINSDIARFENAAPTLPCTYDQTKKLALISTHLWWMPKKRIRRIANWGYAVADASLRTNYNNALPIPKGFPYDYGVG